MVPPSTASRNSPKGDALRNLRKNIDFTMAFGDSNVSNTNQPEEPEVPKSASDEKLSLDQGFIFAQRLLLQINFENSKHQKKTRADGNCWLYACLDQMKYDDVLCRLFDGPKEHYEFRYLVVNSLQENIDNGHIHWDGQRLVNTI